MIGFFLASKHYCEVNIVIETAVLIVTIHYANIKYRSRKFFDHMFLVKCRLEHAFLNSMNTCRFILLHLKLKR